MGGSQLDSGTKISILSPGLLCWAFIALRRSSIIFLRWASRCFLASSLAADVGLGRLMAFLGFVVPLEFTLFSTFATCDKKMLDYFTSNNNFTKREYKLINCKYESTFCISVSKL